MCPEERDDCVNYSRHELIKRIYLDVCVLCRPYDNQSAMRLRLETDAVFLIIEAVRQGIYTLVVSPVHYQEIASIAETRERIELLAFLDKFGTGISGNVMAIRARAEGFYQFGLGVADAAHLAFAEACADVCISCDSRFVKQALKVSRNLVVLTPLQFCEKEDLK